jgi:hypothetical protein
LAEVAATAVALVIGLLMLAVAVLLALAVLLVSPVFLAVAGSLVLMFVIALFYVLLLYCVLLPLMVALLVSKRLIRHPKYTAWVNSMVRTREIRIRFERAEEARDQGERKAQDTPKGDNAAKREDAPKDREGASERDGRDIAWAWGVYTTVVRWLVHHAVRFTAVRTVWTAARAQPRRVWAAAFAVLAAALVGLASYVWRTAAERAEDALHGQGAEPVRILGIEVLGIGAQPTVVTWIGKSPPRPSALTADCYVDLGRANGVLALYDPRTGRVLHVPDTDVVMADRSHC